MKALLAKDYQEDKLVFPIGMMPKIDGVRFVNTDLGPTGRSLKKFKNRHVTKFFNRPEYRWLDTEAAAGHECDAELCRKTSSALGTILGEPVIQLHAFDYMHPRMAEAPYLERYRYLRQYVQHEHSQGRCLEVKTVDLVVARTLEEMYYQESLWLEMGYEGAIARSLDAPYKEGRSTINGAHLLRLKRFIDCEALVEAIEEGETNNNEAQTNELGRTFRSSHKENKIPNGTVGHLKCRLLDDVVHDGKLLLSKDQQIVVSPGNMTEEERKHFFENQNAIVQKMITFKFFPKGIKDKPRFATYKCIRQPEDL